MSIDVDSELSHLMFRQSLEFRDRCNNITNEIDEISRLSTSTEKILASRTAPSILFYGFKRLSEAFIWMITIRVMYFDYRIEQTFSRDENTGYQVTNLDTTEIFCEINRDSILQYENRFPDDEFQYIVNNNLLDKILDDMERYVVNFKGKLKESML